MKPYERPPAEVEYDGKVYPLDLSYAAFFAACDAIEDSRLSEYYRLETALEILVPGKHPVDPGLLQAIYGLVKPERSVGGPKTMDIEQDWSLIVAAFQQAYGIDLHERKDLHIIHFMHLLSGIPKDTKLSEVVGIRSAEIPQANKHNQKQIAELMRLKAIYALRADGGSLNDAWGRLFSALRARAEHGRESR